MSVLYDAPGPRSRRRALIGGMIATALLLLVGLVVVRRLAAQGQFEAEKWRPLFDPSDPRFPLVWRLLRGAFGNTMRAAALAVGLSLGIGTVLGVGRLMLRPWARIPLVGVIELLRGLPVVVSIFFANKVLPELGADLTGWPGGELLWYLVIGLTAYNCVIIAEILRAGVTSLPQGQREAGLAIGMTPWQVMRTIQLPQAFRAMLPALISQLVVIVKDTSLIAVLGGYIELLRQGQLIAQNLQNPIQVFLLVAVIYIAVNIALSRLATWTERRLSRGRRVAGDARDKRARLESSGVGGGA